MHGRTVITAALLWGLLAISPAFAEKPSEEQPDSPRRVVRVKFGFAPWSFPPLTLEVEFSSPAAEKDAKKPDEAATAKDDLKIRPDKQPSRYAGNYPASNEPPRTADVNPIGLDGYCPVTPIQQQEIHPWQRRWTPGDERWLAKYDGVIYHMAGAEEQQKFLKNPGRHTPASAGHDVVLAKDENKMVTGDRRHGIFYKGRIYLFTSEETLRVFSDD